MLNQVRLASRAEGTLMYVKGWSGIFPVHYEDTDCNKLWYKYNDTYIWLIPLNWTETLLIENGTDTVTLKGLEKSTSYRVGFHKSGAPCNNIPYEIFSTRGEYMPIKSLVGT